MAKNYEKYKELLLKETSDFNDYMKEVDKEAYNLKQKRFNKMFDTINNNISELTYGEFRKLVMMVVNDKDIPDEVGKIVESMYLVRALGTIFDE